MTTEQPEGERKAEVHQSTDVIHADPSRDVTKKRQSLSDLFTIVGHATLLSGHGKNHKFLMHFIQ